MTKSDTLVIKKETLWKYSTFILAIILVVMTFLTFNNEETSTGKVVENNNPTQAAGNAVKVDIKGSPVLGDEDAPVTIVEFSDYECPFCGRHYTQTYSLFKKDYIDTGKVKLVFKDFPLSFHPNAQKASEAARCVRDQKGDEGYWQMHDKLFENQGSLSITNYKKWARELGVNGQKFDDCLDSGDFESIVKSDLAYGQEIGVSGTPAFFINGKLLSGAQPYSAFEQAIDSALNE